MTKKFKINKIHNHNERILYNSQKVRNQIKNLKTEDLNITIRIIYLIDIISSTIREHLFFLTRHGKFTKNNQIKHNSAKLNKHQTLT